MSKCFLVDARGQADGAAELLRTSGVSSEACVMKKPTPAFIKRCHEDKDLVVVAVYCNDFERGGIAFLEELKKGLHDTKTKVHALIESHAGERIDHTLYRLAAEVTPSFPLQAIHVATAIKKRWFPANGKTAAVTARHNHESDVRHKSEESDLDEVVVDRLLRHSSSSRSAPAPSPPPVIVHTAQPRTPSRAPTVPALRAPAQEEVLPDSTLERILSGIKKNGPLPKEPVIVSLVGKGGQVVEVDPRRIKPMPENPRWATSPGFTEESLHKLAENMKMVGQLDDALVFPLVGDPDYDGQLIDGERRYRSCKMAGIKLRVKVAGDVTPDMEDVMYLMSVGRNGEKEPPTIRESMAQIKTLRGPRFEMTIAETATFLGMSASTVMKLSYLNKLVPEVQQMLDERQPGKEGETTSGQQDSSPRLTPQLASLLTDISPENQLSLATEILSKRMSYGQARRHVLNVRRGLGLRSMPSKKTKPSRQFEALATLTRRSIELFGVFLDMPTVEMASFLVSRTSGERSGLRQDLRELITSLEELAGRVEVKE